MRILLAAVFAAAAVAPASVSACAPAALDLGAGVTVAPLIAPAADPDVSLEAIDCSRDKLVVRLLAVEDGAPLAVGTLTRRAGGLDLTVTIGRAGTYQVGERVRAAKLNVIDDAGTLYAAGRSGRESRYYPYDWSRKGPATVTELPVDLASPGVLAGGRYVVPSGVDLARQDMVTGPDFAEARLLLTRAAPAATGDRGETGLALRAGEVVTASLDIDDDLQAIERRKWGSPSPMAERMSQLPFRDWSHEGYNLPAAAYGKIAQAAAGGLDALIIRTMAPEKWVADIVKARGLRAYYYQYLAAVRDLDDKGTLPHGVRPEWVLHETRGDDGDNVYTAPTPRHGAWEILDIRRPEVRAYFVDIVEKVLRNGWDGVFYDGPLLWADSQGRFGGDAGNCDAAAGACISFIQARALLLHQVKAAMRRIDPDSRLGMLVGYRFFDELNIADYLLREAVDSGWQHIVSDPLKNEAVYSPAFSRDWLVHEAPLLGTNLVIGAKGENPLLIESALRWANLPLQNVYFDVGDFDPGDVDVFAAALGDLGRFRSGNRITRLSPATARIVTEGPSVVKVDQDVRITLARPLPAIDLTHGRYLGIADAFELSRGSAYAFAEREAAGHMRYSRERFAWLADDRYLFGNVRFMRAPETKDRKLLVVAEGIEDGVTHLRAPVAPHDVLADGIPLVLGGGDGLWRFVLPPHPVRLEIDP